MFKFGLGFNLGVVAGAAGAVTPPSVIQQSIFDHTQTGMVSAGDTSAYTLGMVFRSMVSGYATEIKFWKTSVDPTTTRTVGIYDDIGNNLIASGTSVAEPAGPGWITVPLTTPVRIDPMRVYVATALFPNGRYAAQAGGFTTAVRRGFLEALADNDPAVETGNGRFVAGATLTYPNSNSNAPNYWVDVTVETPEWVGATNTGVPAGTVLTPYAGNMEVTVNGTVVENLRVTGSITINADNVTVRNCEVIADGAYHLIRVMDTILNAKVVDCKIIGSGQAMNGILGRGTFWRNDISGVSNGIAVIGPSDIRDCYMHSFFYDVVDPHYDGIECNGGTLQTYIHNTIIVDQGQTSCVMLDNVAAGLSNIEVAYNYLVGAGYVMYCDASFSAVNVVDGPTINIHHNRCGVGFYGYITINPGVFTPPVPHDNYDAITGLPID